MSAARIPPPAPPTATEWQHPARVGFETLIERGPVLVACLAGVAGVAPPAWSEPIIVLRFGRGADVEPAILDLAWSDAGVIGTLSFSNAAFTCRIPWLAVLSIRPDVGPSIGPSRARETPHLKLVP